MRGNQIEYYLPTNRLTNDELEDIFPQYKGNKIYNKTGIECRHISEENEFASDMAFKACERLFLRNAKLKKKVDFIILCTQTPDYQIPTTACILQDKLKLSVTVGALDVNLGCSGFPYCLSLAKGLLATRDSRGVLIVFSEQYSRHIYPQDRSTRTIFGDGAACLFLSEEDATNIGKSCFGTDGTGSVNLMIPNSGAHRNSQNDEVYEDEAGIRTKQDLYMNGPEIFDFTLERIPKLIDEILQKNGITMEEIKLVIPHQANAFMLHELCEIAGIPVEKMFINMKDTGNTVSPSILIAMKRAMEEGRLNNGDKVLVVGFGVGYSWGGTVLTI